MGDDSDSGLYPRGDGGPAGWELSQRFLGGSPQVGAPQ